jgi:hypothetical protein
VELAASKQHFLKFWNVGQESLISISAVGMLYSFYCIAPPRGASSGSSPSCG